MVKSHHDKTRKYEGGAGSYLEANHFVAAWNYLSMRWIAICH
jgi:hypothetical protein